MPSPQLPRQQADIEQARQQYLSTLALDPDYVGAWINLGNLEASAGDYDAAIRCYQDAIRSGSTVRAGPLQPGGDAGRPLVKLDRKDELVVKHFREALRLKPDWVEAMNNLAWIWPRSEKKETPQRPGSGQAGDAGL